jgi:coenzyme Q-binding protein COQ10
MTKFSVSRHVKFTADQVYAIASDVASYKTFLPLTKQSDVFNERTIADGMKSFDAELTISYKKLGIRETMRSHVTADAGKRLVTATAKDDGPIKHLEATWRIVPEQGGASIVLDIDYTLKSRSLQFLMSGMFDLMMRKIMTAFEHRAEKLYGAMV